MVGTDTKYEQKSKPVQQLPLKNGKWHTDEEAISATQFQIWNNHFISTLDMQYSSKMKENARFSFYLHLWTWILEWQIIVAGTDKQAKRSRSLLAKIQSNGINGKEWDPKVFITKAKQRSVEIVGYNPPEIPWVMPPLKPPTVLPRQQVENKTELKLHLDPSTFAPSNNPSVLNTEDVKSGSLSQPNQNLNPNNSAPSNNPSVSNTGEVKSGSLDQPNQNINLNTSTPSTNPSNTGDVNSGLFDQYLPKANDPDGDENDGDTEDM